MTTQIHYQHECHTLAEWCRIFNLNPNTIYARKRRHPEYTFEELTTTHNKKANLYIAPDLPHIFTLTELSTYLKISKRTLYRKLKSGKIKLIKVDKEKIYAKRY